MSVSQDTLYVAKAQTVTAVGVQALNDHIWKGRNPNFCTSTGSANAQVITLAQPSLYQGYVAGDEFVFMAGYSSGVGAVTLSVVGATTLSATQVLHALIAGVVYRVVYDGSVFQVV